MDLIFVYCNTDPCAHNNNGCEQVCHFDKPARCGCKKGFELREDGKTCKGL